MRFAVLILSLLVAGQAHAASITNLSDKEQQLQLETAQGWLPVVIKPNATWRENGQFRVRFNDREFFLNAYEEYAIWQDGYMGPQRLLFNQSGRTLR